MKYLKLSIVFACTIYCNVLANAQTLIHYWNFNDASTLLIPTQSSVSGAGITYVESTTGTQNPKLQDGTGQDFAALNARLTEGAGSHLRFNDPVGGQITFALPTTGYENSVISYVTRRSAQSARQQDISYSINGTDFIFLQSLVISETPELKTLDFTSIAAADNNPNFKIRIEFVQIAGNGAGNNRFDNFAVDATSIGTGDNVPPVVTVSPLNNATDIALSVTPAFAFNEDIQLSSGVASYADAIIFKKDNASGENVNFNAVLNGKVLTVIPTSNLINNTNYYIALKANSIEDVSGNKITSIQEFSFKTISVQTLFSAGDIVIVAYQMNAVPNVDKFAFITLVDILPGTKINITDAKYTDNTPTQCAGGLVWTAPAQGVDAGTVVTIENDAVTTNIGSLSGNGFGLGSGGDQIILYTGSNTSPDYITALSSNLWLASNTTCSGGNSKLPSGLTDGQSSINLSTANGNASGNTSNAYFNGNLDLSIESAIQIRENVLNPANWIGSASGSAAHVWPVFPFTVAPAVVKIEVVSATVLRIIFNKDLDKNSAETVVNYTGVSNLLSAIVTNNNTKTDTVLLSYSVSFANGQSYTITINNVKDSKGKEMESSHTFTFTFDAVGVVTLEKNFHIINENAGALSLTIKLDKATSGSFDLVLKGADFSTASTADHDFSTQTITFTNESEKIVSINIVNDNSEENDEYFVLSMENLQGLSAGGFKYTTIYIKDDDKKAPVATKQIELEHIGSFDPSVNGSTTEAMAYDPSSRRIVVTSAIQNRFDIVDFSTPEFPQTFKSVDMSSYGAGITGIAVRNGMIAVGSPNANEVLNGSVVFFDIDGNYQTKVIVGSLPDMVCFSPDGTKVLVANEGQPNNSYTVDPEGSVSIIDVSGGLNSINQEKVTTLLFTAFNANAATLIASGVRKTKATSTLSQDLEPEYITFTSDSKKAWVVCQENNSMVEINLDNNTLGDLWPLGTKDYSKAGSGADVSNNNGSVLISNWPVKGFYHPDAIGAYQVNGVNYIVTANEGDEKEYAGLTERVTVGSSSLVLDPVKFPNAEVLKQSYNLGQFRITNLNGDTDNDGDYDELYAGGGRSFSIFNADTRQLVYDSGDDFEYITAQDEIFGAVFNANHENNTLKGRSNAKGCEPEALDIAEIGDHVFAFVGLERVGGVMVYNITNPAAPVFVDYANTRTVASYGGDLGPEYVVYINGQESSDGNHYVLVSNEISGTITIFRLKVEQVITNVVDGITDSSKTFRIYPNPSRNGMVYFNTTADVEVFDVAGKLKYKGITSSLDVNEYAKGIYIVKTSKGAIERLLVE